MAPTITSTADYPKEHLSLNHKIRKPVVEKMRRDRINSSIEELKALLGPQLLNQQPESKLEKADILEMTVGLLRQQLQQKTLLSTDSVHQGLSMFTHSVNGHLVQASPPTVPLSHLQALKASSDEDMEKPVLYQLSVLDQHTLSREKSPVKSTPWRPW
ncbi:transcription factor HES-5-like [Clupea harengus]|uniref:Transcription factor HES-5 n=1 Tax=Clupea harengus TaxID=7950 RepID=A0A6P3WE52_CLUHA|nr:transcription factor HES-5-like [Clupea harengus]